MHKLIFVILTFASGKNLLTKSADADIIYLNAMTENK